MLVSNFKIIIIVVIAFVVQNCDYSESDYYCQLGDEKCEEGIYWEAIELYSKAIELNPYNAGAYNNRGIAKFMLEDDLAAISDYEKAIKLDSVFYEAYNNLGLVKMYLYGLDEGEYYFNKTLEINDSYIEAYYNRGLLHFVRGDYEKSVKDFEKCIQLNPEDAEAFYLCGLARIENGDEYWGKYDINDAKKLGFTQFDESNLLDAIVELKKLNKK